MTSVTSRLRPQARTVVFLGRAETLFLWLRGLLYRGPRHRCPCCGAGIRTFTHGGGSLRPRPNGYCPRCNAKARHRQAWLVLAQRGLLGTLEGPLLAVAPKPCELRALSLRPRVVARSVDLVPTPGVSAVADLTALPFSDAAFDAAICIHVLEHVDDDGAAMRQLRRVLRPGGWALIGVPCRLDSITYEDPAVTDPVDRRRAFGEADHRRVYGADIVDRLSDAGLDVEVIDARAVDESTRRRHGLNTDEHMFLCRRPSDEPAS